MSHFKETANINTMAGNPTDADWDALESQYELIVHELEEMREHLDERDADKLRDDVGDVLFTTFGMGHRAGFPVDEDYAEVCRSNWTKFDRTTALAEQTWAKYNRLGVDVHATAATHPAMGETMYVTRSTQDQIGTDGKKYPKGKWLKSVNFEEPNYAQIDRTLPISMDAMKETSRQLFINRLIVHGVYITANNPNDIPVVHARVVVKPVMVGWQRRMVSIEGYFFCEDTDPTHTASRIAVAVYLALSEAAEVGEIIHIVHSITILDETHALKGVWMMPNVMNGEDNWIYLPSGQEYPYRIGQPETTETDE